MIRKESIGITNVMKSIQNAKEIDWKGLYSMDPQDRLDFVNN